MDGSHLREWTCTEGVIMNSYSATLFGLHRSHQLEKVVLKAPLWSFKFHCFLALHKAIASVYGILSTYIWLIFMINVGEYTIHGILWERFLPFFLYCSEPSEHWKNPMRQHDKSLRNNFTLGKSRIKSWLKVAFYPGLWVWRFQSLSQSHMRTAAQALKVDSMSVWQVFLWDQFWFECFDTAPCQPSQWRARTGFDPDVTSWTAENTKTESFTLKNWWLEDDYKVGP